MKIVFTSDTHRGFSEKTYKIHQLFLQKMSEENADLYIIAGDLAVNRQKQFYSSLKDLRNFLGKNAKICIVRGNHDFQDATFNHHFGEWNIHQKSFKALLSRQNEWFEQFEIIHLQKNSIKIDDLLIVGFDGWYGFTKGETLSLYQELKEKGNKVFIPSDLDRLTPFMDGVKTYDWLKDTADSEFLRTLNEVKNFNNKEKTILVTHMPIYHTDDKYILHDGDITKFNKIAPYINTLIHGHSHLDLDFNKNDVRVITSGSDYDKPKYKVLNF